MTLWEKSRLPVGCSMFHKNNWFFSWIFTIDGAQRFNGRVLNVKLIGCIAYMRLTGCTLL